MDEKIWRKLPTDLIRLIISKARLPIDTRVYFRLAPSPIPHFDRAQLEWKLLAAQSRMTYFIDSASLHVSDPTCYTVVRPVEYERIGDVSIINPVGDDFQIEITYPDGRYVLIHSEHDVWFTTLDVMLRGGGPTT
jgi:hypothetical protein